MNKNFKSVYVRGTETGKGVIEALINLGGKNNRHYDGKDVDYIYFIAPDNIIYTASITSAYASYIMATAEELKPVRWRAKKCGIYYYITSDFKVKEVCDYRDAEDEACYKCGNYFRTREEAEEAAEKIKKILLPD